MESSVNECVTVYAHVKGVRVCVVLVSVQARCVQLSRWAESWAPG